MEEQAMWEWYPCKSSIVNYNQLTGKSLELISDSQVIIDDIQTEIQLTINLTKPFNFTQEIGWNWHKSWNLPDILCYVKLQSEKNNDIPKNIKLNASLLVVKALYQTMNLESLGCKGNTNQIICNGKCTFKGLKFNTTSYNNEHSKFQIVIVITQTLDNGEQKILCSRISSSVFVDSRKQARGIQKTQSIQPFIDPFLPENLDKQLYKRESRNNQHTIITIDNTLNGMINYFTSANIRHKIKHPLFLAIRFDQSVKLFVNQKYIISKDPNSLVDLIQMALFRSNLGAQSQKMICLLIDLNNSDHQTQKRIMDIISVLENDRFFIITSIQQIPKDFMELDHLSEISSCYRSQYPNLVNLRFNEITQTDNVEPKIQKQVFPIKKEEKVEQADTPKQLSQKLISSQQPIPQVNYIDLLKESQILLQLQQQVTYPMLYQNSILNYPQMLWNCSNYPNFYQQYK